MIRRQQAMSYRADGDGTVLGYQPRDQIYRQLTNLITHILVDMGVEEKTVGSPREWFGAPIQMVIRWYLG